MMSIVKFKMGNTSFRYKKTAKGLRVNHSFYYGYFLFKTDEKVFVVWPNGINPLTKGDILPSGNFKKFL